MERTVGRLASFCYNGDYVALNPDTMRKISETRYEYVLPDGLCALLDIDCCAENAFSVLLSFENRGHKPSGQISHVRSLDYDLIAEDKLHFHGLTGDCCGTESYNTLDFDLSDGEARHMEPKGGRSSDTTAFPFFDLSGMGKTWVLGIGWSGQWAMDLFRQDGCWRVCVGLADADFYLNSGESVRTARVLCVQGSDAADTRRAFRRVMLEKFSPVTRLGRDMTMPVSYQPFDLYFYSETEKYYQGGRRRRDWATEQGQKTSADMAVRGHMDTLWLDAGWFDVGFPRGVGNYCFAKGFPNGLEPVTDYAHAKGLRFVLWFEPERVCKNTEVYNEHYDMLLFKPDGGDALFNLADDKARVYLRDKLIAFIRDNGIDVYRQDFNFEPLPYWRAHDEEGRRGVTEMKYVAGHYALWDALLDACPGLLIDDCASGGRRIDLETCSRAVMLWRSDTGCFPVSETHRGHTLNQNHILALTQYIPFHACACWDTDAYSLRAAYSGGLACTFDLLNPEFDFGRVPAIMNELKRTQPYWTGDFYPLTAPDNSEEGWAAWQLDREGNGIVCAFRRDHCDQEAFAPEIRALQGDAVYDVMISDEQLNVRHERMTGEALGHFSLHAAAPKSSVLLEYRKMPEK